MIQLVKPDGYKILDLGGGENPHPLADVNIDVRKTDKVHFAVDFNNPPFPMKDEEWDCVVSQFALEHVSYRHIPALLKEVFRLLKEGGRFVGSVPNTPAQIQWILNHPGGWDGRNFFESASGVLFGDQDYPENSHKCFFNHSIITRLFTEAGFVNIMTAPYGERNVDMMIDATKPAKTTSRIDSDASSSADVASEVEVSQIVANASETASVVSSVQEYKPEEWFDKSYFNGGKKMGGYFNEGYRDFPLHQVIFQNLMRLRPSSVLELGCARGYVLKRFQDQAGIRANGLDVSKHCHMTRVCNGIIEHDVTNFPWPWKNEEFDLCYSVSLLEHIPEHLLPDVLKEMVRVSKRCAHAVNTTTDGLDKTKVTIHDIDWWNAFFTKHIPERDRKDLPYMWDVMNVAEINRGDFPKAVLDDKGKVKINLGSHIVMFHHGWINLDILELDQFAQLNGFNFRRHDFKHNLPFNTSSVDLIYTSHMLEHFNYREGLAILRDCRRVIKADGAMRIMVPDAKLLNDMYAKGTDLSRFNELNDGCEVAPTQAAKLWAMLHDGHSATYDAETMIHFLKEAGFEGKAVGFREGSNSLTQQIVRETIDMFPAHSLYVDAIPLS